MAEHKPLYLWSSREAQRAGEQDLWKESFEENCRCARAIEDAIKVNFDGKTLNTDCVREIIDEFGFDRTNWVLSNTVRQKKDDGRFSPTTKAWAAKTYIPPEDTNRQFTVESHPAVVDGFITNARNQWQDLKLYDSSHCISEKHGAIDYKGKVLVLHPSVLKDEFKTPNYQLFLATSGFGCSPTASGRKVFGRFLFDDEETYYYRNDFIGAIKNDHLPQWAWDKVMPPIRSVMAAPGQGAQEVIASTHWDGIRQLIDCETPMCDGMELNDGLVNVYYDPDGKAHGKPFNRRIGDREYYGPILINGMRSFDQPLSEVEAKTLVGWLNDQEVMMENPVSMEPYTGVPEPVWEDIPTEMPRLVMSSPIEDDIPTQMPRLQLSRPEGTDLIEPSASAPGMTQP